MSKLSSFWSIFWHRLDIALCVHSTVYEMFCHIGAWWSINLVFASFSSFLINFGFSSSRSQVIRVYSLKSIPSVIRQNDTKEKKVTENVQIATFGLKQKLSHWLRNRSDVQTIFLITYDCILSRGNWFCLWLKLSLKRSWTIRFIVSLSFNRVLCWAC